jgi:hypothetical protein
MSFGVNTSFRFRNLRNGVKTVNSKEGYVSVAANTWGQTFTVAFLFREGGSTTGGWTTCTSSISSSSGPKESTLPSLASSTLTTDSDFILPSSNRKRQAGS